MKRIWYILASILLVSMLFYSCQKDDSTSYDETLLYGEWVSGTEHWHYKSNHTGVFWDTKDTDSEADGRQYTWVLDMSSLELTLKSTSGEWGVPKNYTVTELTATTLKYKDSFSSYSFSKTN